MKKIQSASPIELAKGFSVVLSIVINELHEQGALDKQSLIRNLEFAIQHYVKNQSDQSFILPFKMLKRGLEEEVPDGCDPERLHLVSDTTKNKPDR